jgi:hypothetical protein
MISKKVLDADFKIELGKGYFGLGEYICLDQTQQEHLLIIPDLISNYAKRTNPKRPLNIYIEASPGTGKSYFVKQVISAVKTTFTKKSYDSRIFNITTMQSPQELIEAFRIVQSINIEGKLPIVFFDEIDSALGNSHHTYPLFLTSMFDGKIYERGNEFRLGSAVFFFAASGKISELVNEEKEKEDNNLKNNKSQPLPYKAWIKEERKKLKETRWKWRNMKNKDELPNKLPDFIDRIDRFVHLPPTNIMPNDDLTDLRDQSQMIVVAFIMKHFPNIRYIDSKALGVLSSLILNFDSLRDLDTVIFNSGSPTDDIFRSINLPYDFRKKYKEKFDLIEFKIGKIILDS